jgi:hypothetical protein
MVGKNLTEKLRTKGYLVELSGDWQCVDVRGTQRIPSELRESIKANKHEIRLWLVAEAFAEKFQGRVIIPHAKNNTSLPGRREPYRGLTWDMID